MDAAEPSTGLVVTGLTKRYGTKAAVADLSFRVAPGEILALLGPNGAGKSTTLTCLAGLLRPNAGSFEWNGRDLGPARSRSVGLIPETPEVYEMLTVWEHLAFVARSCRLPAGWESQAAGLLSRLQLDEQRDTLGQALSKGMRQKLLVTAVVLAGTPVLLLDEPMVGLDPMGQHELREMLAQLRQEGRAIVISTHLLASVESYCDRLLILNRGAAVAEGRLADLVEEHGKRTLEEAFLDIVR
ncbi:MAG TPA: ABC transporter ATP-binding protein [Candidatus Dormibacteraeota bacterium]|jgi:ABC-2 type transport system ATP-binding protein|nr:ABC transporter ATP-binding protein [Candidatus Dormibacteraeota bacterium]